MFIGDSLLLVGLGCVIRDVFGIFFNVLGKVCATYQVFT